MAQPGPEAERPWRTRPGETLGRGRKGSPLQAGCARGVSGVCRCPAVALRLGG